MSKAKKYYWLKLKDDFFADPKVKKLRRIAGGDTYTVIYLKMMLLSIKSGGVIEFHGIEKTLHEELSLILDEDEVNVNATLIYLEKMNMIESYLEQSYLLKNIPELIGSESDSKERVQRFRDKQKQIESVTCNADVTQCNENVTTEKREKRKENKIEEIEIDTSGVNPLALEEWFKYKGSKYTKQGKTLTINFLKEYDESTQLEIVRASIMNGWKGLFEPKKKPKQEQRMDISKLPEGVSLQDMLNAAGEEWEREQEQKLIGGVR